MVRERILRWVDRFVRLPTVGFDISDFSVKYLEFITHGDKISVGRFGELVLPEGLVVKGEIVRVEELAKLLKEWGAKEGRALCSSFFTVSLPEEKSYLRVIQLPKIKQEEVPNAIRWEIEANIPLPLDELVFDYEIVGSTENHQDHLDVAITAFPRSIVESYVRTFELAGLNLFALELESLALVRAAASDIDPAKSIIIVDIGHNRASFAFFSGGSVVFTQTNELGGKVFEENIARSLGVDRVKAALIKKEVGLNKKEYEGKVFSALLPAVSVLLDELRRSISYYHDYAHLHEKDRNIDEILLTGGDSNLLGLDTYIGSALKIPVYRFRPFVTARNRLLPTIPPISRSQAMAFSAAIGLAMRP